MPFRVGDRILDRPVRLLVGLVLDDGSRCLGPLEVAVDVVYIDMNEGGGPSEVTGDR